jgi:hypothetical protein
MRYLKATADTGLIYRKTVTEEMRITGFSDADWGGDKDTGKSVSRYLIFAGGNLVHFKSKRQNTVATSTAHAELEAAYCGIIDAIWIKNCVNEFGAGITLPIKWYCDNQTVIKITNSDKSVNKTKHLMIKTHFLREKTKRKEVEMEYVGTDEMTADILTKALGKPKHDYLMRKMNTGNWNGSNRKGMLGDP